MQPLLIVATLVAVLGVVSVKSDTAYVLAPVQHGVHHQPRVLSSGWGWRPVKTYSIALPTIQRGWGWKKPQQHGWGSSGVSFGIYGGLRIGPKQQQGWGWPQKQQGWGWGKPQHHGGHGGGGWGWKKPQQHGWGWSGDDSDEEDDYRSTVPELAYDDEPSADSSEEIADDDASGSFESAEDDSAEDDHIDLTDSVSYDPVFV